MATVRVVTGIRVERRLVYLPAGAFVSPPYCEDDPDDCCGTGTGTGTGTGSAEVGTGTMTAGQSLLVSYPQTSDWGLPELLTYDPDMVGWLRQDDSGRKVFLVIDGTSGLSFMTGIGDTPYKATGTASDLYPLSLSLTGQLSSGGAVTSSVTGSPLGSVPSVLNVSYGGVLAGQGLPATLTWQSGDTWYGSSGGTAVTVTIDASTGAADVTSTGAVTLTGTGSASDLMPFSASLSGTASGAVSGAFTMGLSGTAYTPDSLSSTFGGALSGVELPEGLDVSRRPVWHGTDGTSHVFLLLDPATGEGTLFSYGDILLAADGEVLDYDPFALRLTGAVYSGADAGDEVELWVTETPGGGGGGSGGPVTTTCCPGSLTPSRIYLNLTSTSGCGCLTGTYHLDHNASTSRWTVTLSGVCEPSADSTVEVWCDGSTWKTRSTGGCVWAETAFILGDCDPLQLTATSLTVSGCCSGTVAALVTETP